MITQTDLQALVKAASLAGFEISTEDVSLIHWRAGATCHIPTRLPKGYSAVYVFKWNDVCLKVGKVNSNSNARYQSQHYHPNSSPSNLSKSLMSKPDFQILMRDIEPKYWLVATTNRYNILIPEKYGKNLFIFRRHFLS